MIKRTVKYSRYGLLLFLLLSYGCSSNIQAPVVAMENNVKRELPTMQTKNKRSHVVDKRDTLYAIAWRYSKNHMDLARWNDIKKPFVIYPGQLISLESLPPVEERSTKLPNNVSKKPSIPTLRIAKQSKRTAKLSKLSKIVWQWPVQGNLIQIDLPTSKKGVNISGKIGQFVKAAATGEVVYSSGELTGYGKLIIIKHNRIYLSAYAYNSKALKKEGTQVSRGEKIATMGIASNGKPLLHFEIRRDGRSVDPLQYLPQKRP